MRFILIQGGTLAWYRTLEWTKRGICKRISQLQSYLDEQCTTVEAIQKAYQASNEAAQAAKSKGQQPCLIGSVDPPRQRSDGYEVMTSPQGFPPIVNAEEVQLEPSYICTASHCELCARSPHYVTVLMKEWPIALQIQAYGYHLECCCSCPDSSSMLLSWPDISLGNWIQRHCRYAYCWVSKTMPEPLSQPAWMWQNRMACSSTCLPALADQGSAIRLCLTSIPAPLLACWVMAGMHPSEFIKAYPMHAKAWVALCIWVCWSHLANAGKCRSLNLIRHSTSPSPYQMRQGCPTGCPSCLWLTEGWLSCLRSFADGNMRFSSTKSSGGFLGL